MSFAPVPATAAWHHRGARSGFEVAYFGARGDRCQIEGWTTAIEDGLTWAVEYVIEVDAAWATRSARIRGRSGAGFCSALLEADGAGHWLAGGKPAPYLDGCLDVDLEASALTNALPVRRMGLPVSGRAAAPAAYLRAAGLAVERLEQTYMRITDEAACQRYEYAAPAFDFAARLVYDKSGLVLDYPGIAVRAGCSAWLASAANRVCPLSTGLTSPRWCTRTGPAWPVGQPPTGDLQSPSSLRRAWRRVKTRLPRRRRGDGSKAHPAFLPDGCSPSGSWSRAPGPPPGG